VLNSEELLESVPHEDHDRRVGAVATEDGILRF
jgi:5-formyltetrahydrofolate cyclo-ligase